jgi:stage V sporulation protein R
MVINNDPTYAYLVRSNSDMEQKLVMAHVFGHADFFKHNVWFSPTERRMLDVMASHGTRIRRLIDQHGQDEVERFLDLALSLDNLIDPYLPLRAARSLQRPDAERESRVERARRSLEAALDGRAVAPPPPVQRELPTFDVLGYLVEHAPLGPWQRELLRIVRDEAYYFLPQRVTKVMNEGWASFWHSRILTAGVLDADEIIDFADCHSGATAAAPGQLNPYKLGIDLFRHAERRGLDLFRLRRVHSDATFVDTVLDEDFAHTSQLFLYQRNGRNGRMEIASRDFAPMKAQILRDLTWGGVPQIELVQAGEPGKGELLLRHRHDGRDLQLAQAGQTLRQLARLWGGAVHLLTLEEGQGRRVTSDGQQVRVLDSAEAGGAAHGPEEPGAAPG